MVKSFLWIIWVCMFEGVCVCVCVVCMWGCGVCRCVCVFFTYFENNSWKWQGEIRTPPPLLGPVACDMRGKKPCLTSRTQKETVPDFLVVQRPRLQASNAENPCELIPGQETRPCTLRLKIPHASRRAKTLCRPAGTQRSQVNEYIFLKGKKQCQYEIGSISLGRKGEKILRKMLKAYIYIYIFRGL